MTRSHSSLVERCATQINAPDGNEEERSVTAVHSLNPLYSPVRALVDMLTLSSSAATSTATYLAGFTEVATTHPPPTVGVVQRWSLRAPRSLIARTSLL